MRCLAYDSARFQVHPPLRPPYLFLVREGSPVYGSEHASDPLNRAEYASDPLNPADHASDPFNHADALEALEEEVVTLAAHIHSATQRLLALIAEFDRRRGWELRGHRTAAHWLSFRTGIDLGAAREKVRAARALEALPQTRASMARGELSFSKVRALTRVATPENEGDLLELARGATTAQLERMVRAFHRGTREEEADLDGRRHERRCFSVFPDEDGMYLVRGRLPAEIGALLMRAVDAASDALFREEWTGLRCERVGGRPPEEAFEEAPAEEQNQDRIPGTRGRMRLRATAEGGINRTRKALGDSERKAAQRRADALGLLAERALATGFENGPISGTRAARYQVVLHVEEGTLRAGEETPEATDQTERVQHRSDSAEHPPRGRSELEDGTRVSAETSQRISCDCGLVRVTHARSGAGPRGVDRCESGPRGPGGTEGDGLRSGSARSGTADFAPICSHPSHEPPILNVGRRTRTIPPSLRRALEVRDRGCRFPGCGSRFADGHHVRHWADGGETSLDNCVLLCRHHHRLVHEGGWRVDWWGRGRPVFFDPRGGTHFEGRWEPLEEAEHVSAETLIRDNRRRGVFPDGWTPSARWKGEGDIPDEVLFRAGEALCG